MQKCAARAKAKVVRFKQVEGICTSPAYKKMPLTVLVVSSVNTQARRTRFLNLDSSKGISCLLREEEHPQPQRRGYNTCTVWRGLDEAVYLLVHVKSLEGIRAVFTFATKGRCDVIPGLRKLCLCT